MKLWSKTPSDANVARHDPERSLQASPQRGVLFTYWADPEGDKKHEAAIQTMIKSIKKVGN